MGKPRFRSVLYRLIEAGQMARHALLAPLEARGLAPGDDAVLFLLRAVGTTSEADLAAALGLSGDALAPRLKRLRAFGLLEQRATGASLQPGVALTEAGAQTRKLLEENWDQLEEALLGELTPKKRKALRRTLERFVELLDPEIRPDA